MVYKNREDLERNYKHGWIHLEEEIDWNMSILLLVMEYRFQQNSIQEKILHQAMKYVNSYVVLCHVLHIKRVDVHQVEQIELVHHDHLIRIVRVM